MKCPPETLILKHWMSPRYARKTRNDVLCTSALPIGQLPTDDIAVRPVRERRLERRRPLRVLVVDRDEPERACVLARQSVSPPLPLSRIKSHAPRPNAIRCSSGDIQPVIPALPTAFRNPTMPAIAFQRCWQSQPFAPKLPEHVPAPPLGGPASASVIW